MHPWRRRPEQTPVLEKGNVIGKLGWVGGGKRCRPFKTDVVTMYIRTWIPAVLLSQGAVVELARALDAQIIGRIYSQNSIRPSSIFVQVLSPEGTNTVMQNTP